MNTGGTDSRFLRNIGMPVYGRLGPLREFLYRLVKRLAN
jgi:hypothetical protein